MSQVALYRGQGAESVWVGDNGATFTNIGPDIVYYGDQNVSSTVNTGSIAVGASVSLTGSPYLVLAPTATRAYVNVAANPSSGEGVLYGAGAPSDSLGVNGDSYIDTTNQRLYGPKALGAWPATYISLVPSAKAARAKIALASVASSPVRFTVIGDSLSQGYYGANPMYANGWVGLLRTALASDYAVGGSGVVIIRDSTQYTAEADPRLVFTGSWTDFGDLGFLGNFLRYATGTGNYMEFTPTEQVDHFNVYYAKGGGGGTFSMAVDGGSATTVDSSGSGSGVATISAGSLGTHTLRVTAPASNNVFLAGVEGTVTSGLRVDRLGVAGSAIAAANSANAAAAALNFDLKPADLTILAHAVNDFLQQTALTTFRTNYISAIEHALAYGDAMLQVPPPPGDAGAIPWSAYAGVIRQLAQQYVLPIVDFTALWGSRAAHTSWYFDQHHPSPAGHVEMASTMHTALLAAVA